MAMRRDQITSNSDTSRNDMIKLNQNALLNDGDYGFITSPEQSILRLNLHDQVDQSRDLVFDDDTNSEVASHNAECANVIIVSAENIEEASTLGTSRVLQLSSKPPSSRYCDILSKVPGVSRQMDHGSSSSGTTASASINNMDVQSGWGHITMASSSTSPRQETFNLYPNPNTIGHIGMPQRNTYRRIESLNPQNLTPSAPLDTVGANLLSGRRFPFTRENDLGSLSTQQGPTNPRSPRLTSRARRSQPSGHPPGFSPGHDQGSEFASRPGLTLFGHITDTLQQAQARPRNLGHSDQFHGPSGYQLGRSPLPPPHILEMMRTEMDRSHETFENRIHDATHPLPDELLDVYQMSYEELLVISDEDRNEEIRLVKENIMANLTQRYYDQSRNSEPSACVEICPICREDYVDQESIGTLDCNHEFHTHCITLWLLRKNECPICKMPGLDRIEN